MSENLGLSDQSVKQEPIKRSKSLSDIADQSGSTFFAVSLQERLQFVIDKTGLKARPWSEKAGLGHGYVNNLLKDPNAEPSAEKLGKLARAAGANEVWLITGKGESGLEKARPGSPLHEELSPLPPPSTGPRLKQTRDDDHWFPDEIEGLTIKVLRRPDVPEPTLGELRSSKVFVREATHKLAADTSWADFMAAVLRAARAVSRATGRDPTPDDIYAQLVAAGARKFSADPEPDALDEMMAEEQARQDREGHVAPRPAKPVRAVDATTPSKPRKKS